MALAFSSLPANSRETIPQGGCLVVSDRWFVFGANPKLRATNSPNTSQPAQPFGINSSGCHNCIFLPFRVLGSTDLIKAIGLNFLEPHATTDDAKTN